jgi:hypothetical protein
MKVNSKQSDPDEILQESQIELIGTIEFYDLLFLIFGLIFVSFFIFPPSPANV